MKTQFPFVFRVFLWVDRRQAEISRLCTAFTHWRAVLANNEPEKLTGEQIHLGSLAKQCFREGKNPPCWVDDEAAWSKAKEAASKTYSMDDDAFWPVVTSIYQNMGGSVDRTKALKNDGSDGAFGVLMNEAVVGPDGWALIPFGDWPHEMGVQKFHREQAQALCNAFAATAGRFRRAIVGLPIFKGHPDHPVAAIANQYPDKEDKGQVADMEVRDNGLALRLVLSNAGAKLVQSGWKFISPLWIANLISAVGEKYRVFAPSVLRSVGLVSKPNIPTPSLANSAASAGNQNKTMNKEQILKLLGLPETATDSEISARLTALGNAATALANEQAALTTAKGTITALEGRATKAESDLGTTRTALANERKGRIEAVVAQATRQGRIVEAEKAVWIGRLEANFDAEAAVLANAAPKVKTESEIPGMLKKLEAQMRKDLANAKPGKTDPADKSDDSEGDDGTEEHGFSDDQLKTMPGPKKRKVMENMVNQHMAKLANTPDKARYNKAFENAKKANPKLFGNMAPDTGPTTGGGDE